MNPSIVLAVSCVPEKSGLFVYIVDVTLLYDFVRVDVGVANVPPYVAVYVALIRLRGSITSGTVHRSR